MAQQLHLTPKEGLIRLGHISSAQGLKGLVRIYSETSNPEDLCSYGTLWDATKEKQFSLKLVRVQKNFIICRIENITTREQAETLKGTMLCIEKENLPQTEDDEFYHLDLLGLLVQDEKGQTLGKIQAIQDFGAGSMLDIALSDQKRSVYIPFTEEFVPVVDIQNQHVQVQGIDNLLEPVRSGSRRRRPPTQ